MTAPKPQSARERLLELLLQQRQAQKGAAPITRHDAAIGRQPAIAPAPLTHTQRRAWFLAQLDPDSTAYSEARAYRVRGPLDAAALKASLRALVARHDILRTTYSPVGDEPAQFLHDEAAVDFTVIDLASRPGAEREELLGVSLAEAAREPFDLSRGPLLRFRVIRLDDDDHGLLLTWHHILADGWSAGVFERELSAHYNGRIAGEPVDLPPLPAQYADYALWQREWLASPVLAQQLAWWKTQLADLATVPLPIDRPRPALQSDHGARVDTPLSAEVCAGLKALARTEGATLFMVGLAAFKVLLSRYTGCTDIAIGTPIAGRTRPEVEGLIGFFANTLVLRTDLSGAQTFRQLLGQVRATAVTAYANQDLPFERLVQELAPVRDPSRNPLFQVSYAMRNLAGPGLGLEGLDVARIDLPTGHAKFDLSLDLLEGDGQLRARFEYCTDLFEPATIRQLAGHFGVLLAALVADPDQSIDTLTLMSAAERQRILVEWSEAAATHPRDQTLAGLFADQVRRTPEAVAVSHADQDLTYAQLNVRANRLAHHLGEHGVGPEVPVALCLERSPDLIVALLAIVKAGGTYVPLDADQPVERLGFLLQDSAAALVLTQSALLPRLPAGACPHLCLDRDGPGIVAHRADNPPDSGTPRQLACVIYTSGSTGTPKGVAIRQEGVIRLVIRPNYVDLGPTDTLAQVANVAFDAATFEIWGALLNGARLVILPRDTILSPPRLAAALVTHRVSCLFLTTALFNRVSSESPDAFRTLRHVLFGGEVCDPDRVRAVLQAGPPARLVHVYGPTEATTFSTFHVVRSTDARATIPIGQPVSGTQVLLLDPRGALVPPGVVGEIYIGGPGVAAGYVNRPAESRAHFVPSPIDPASGALLYRTGDLARWLPDGTLEFLGRNDEQVKIRGFRIEPAEISAALAAHDQVRACHVRACRQPGGDLGLTAYVVLDGSNSGPPSPATLRAFLTDRLPPYMVPTTFVPLASLPLTANGKVDARALPAPRHANLGAPVGYAAPGTALESLIAGIWAGLLALPRVGVHDDFFALGGHSLLAGRLAARLTEQCGVELPLRRIFEHPTVAALARDIERLRGGGESARPIPRAPRTGPLPLSCAQDSLWFLDQLSPGSTAYSLPVTLRLSGPLDAQALRSAFGVLIERHEPLRTHFATVDGEARQIIAAAGPVHLQEHDLRGFGESSVEARARDLVRQETNRPFDLGRGPLLRVLLLRLADHEHVLTINAHHIITDGWSVDVLLRELQALYGALHSGRGNPLPVLPVQFADYAVWQRARLQGARLEALMGYWRGKLADLQPLSLPTDRPRPARLSDQGGTETLVIPAQLLGALKLLAGQHSATLFMVLLAAYQLLLMRLSGQEDVAVGSPVAGRERAELDGLIGLFLNTLVLRTDLSGNPTFEQLLARARQTALDAYAHQDLPFERLVAALNPGRDLNHNPLFDVLINHIDGETLVPGLPGLHVRPVSPASVQAKFALTLYIRAQEDCVHLRLVYQSDLYSPERARCLLDQFAGLLAQIAAAPAQQIHAYTLVTPGSRSRLPDPRAVLDEPARESVVAQVLGWAQRSPGQVAVRTPERRWTYAELATRATSLAMRLRSLPLGRGDIVALLGPRGFGMVGAMLAVLMSGGAFLTLDPALPVHRRRTMVKLARVRAVCLIGQTPGSEQDLGLDAGIRVLQLDAGLAPPPGSDSDAPAGLALPMPRGDDAAYVFFTSGSTGEPKGILGSHKGLSHFLNWQRETFAISPDERVSQLISLTFDPLLRDVFLPLTSGATVCVPADADLLDTPGWLDREGVTVVHTTPTVMQSWLAAGEDRIELPRLRLLFISGEPLTATLVNRWRARFPGPARVVNLYGPTETTMARCYYPIPAVVSPGVQPVGTPLPESQALLLNDAGQLCGVGETGEIHLRTPFRSLGYLNLPGETARCFRPNPFRDDPEDIVYATGDRGRYRPDGLLEIAGRVDDQVKIRGVRVEPGEVATNLLLHRAVRECIVVAREDRDGQPQLVGYITCKPGQSTDASALRAHLKARLPEVFIPAAFVFLDSLPQLPSGKVDRHRLPAPTVEPAEVDRVSPRSPLEQAVADLWGEILGTEVPGVHADFFAVGGHSLLAIRVVSRLNKLCGVELPVRVLFEFPTVAGLARAVDQLRQQRSAARQRLLDLRARQKEAGKASAEPNRRDDAIAPRSVTGPVPLAHTQRRAWFLAQLDPDSTAYNEARAYAVRGPLDIAALQDGLRALITRHEILRTTYATVGDEPGQFVHQEPALDFAVLDLPARAGPQRAELLSGTLAAAARQPFDLARGPLLRFRVIRLGENDYVLLRIWHHILADGWSGGVFDRELSALYNGQMTGQPAPLPVLPIQYADYALWQREWLATPGLKQQLDYWTAQLAGLATLELSSDQPRPALQSYRGARLEVPLADGLAERLRGLGRQEGATLFMAGLAAFKVLLYRYSGTTDIAIGTPIAGRNRVELEGLIGFFANTLVLRTDLSGALTFRQVLARVRETALGAYTHPDVPFEKLVEALAPARDPSRNPLFQVCFAVQSLPRGGLTLHGLEAGRIDLPAEHAKFDLSLDLVDRDGRFHASFEYCTDLFEPATIERLAGHFGVLLGALLDDPDQSIDTLDLMSAAERRRILVEWNDTTVDYPQVQTLARSFEAQAQRTPDALALRFVDETLTYAQLNARANRLAHCLRARGVGPDVPVAICMERSAHSLVGILAILKAGGAYLPLDPQYPQERLAFMRADAGAPVVLTHAATRDRFAPDDSRILCVDTDQLAITSCPVTNPDNPGSPDDLAYIIYTSGSTGTPKGVQITQRGICNHLAWISDRLQLSSADRVLHFTSISFDASVWEMLAPLQVGASLHLARPGDERDMAALAGMVQQQQLTVLQVVPSMLRALLAEAQLERCRSLRSIVCGGEPLDFELVERLRGQAPWARLGNFYGPTEASIDATHFEVTAQVHGTGFVPIGRPIANVRCHVLSGNLQPVPIGVIGELYIGGAGLARGYLNRAELTAGRFIADPFRPGERLYRTGDLVRYLPDGSLAFAGRNDAQVKVRGYRIELGEIEAALQRCAGVRDCAVLAREDQPGLKRLVAYAAGQIQSQALNPAALLQQLKQRLPDYMLPAAIVLLEHLPLLPNGKLDRRALPSPEHEQPAPGTRPRARRLKA